MCCWGRWSSALLLWLLWHNVRAEEEDWPVCDNRAYRDEEVEPGGLKLLGVKESPLGAFPRTAAAATHEHFFQQLREIWSDDCPRLMVQLGLQPAPGRWRNWSAAALWLHYFNHSGTVLVADAVEDYLAHAEQGLLALAQGKVEVLAAKAALAPESRPRAGERPVSFDTGAGGKVAAADEVMRACTAVEGPDAEEEAHPCSGVLRRMSMPEPLEYSAAVRSFDDIWRRELRGRHVDFLQVDLGSATMQETLRRGFERVVKERQVSVLAFRVDEHWTKAALREVVRWLDVHEYFSLFKLFCADSSQLGTFSYLGPGERVGPTTYLPISGVDFDEIMDWDNLPLPQDVFAFDLRQPDIFKAVQLGDVQCDAEEGKQSAEGTCSQEDGSCREEVAAPERPQQFRVVATEAHVLRLQWRAHPEGPRPQAYLLRVEAPDLPPREVEVEHNMFDAVSGLQSHVLSSLQPGKLYSLTLYATGPQDTRSLPATLEHRTEAAPEAAASAAWEVIPRLHCGMTPTEELQPAGPPPRGVSFFRDTTDAVNCQARCHDEPRCLSFQVKLGDACWLYRQRPRPDRVAGPRLDADFTCGIRRQGS